MYSFINSTAEKNKEDKQHTTHNEQIIKDIIDKYSPSKIKIAIQLSNNGIQAKRDGRYEDAIFFYKKVIEMFPEAGSIYYNLGKLFYLMNDFEHSRRAYTLAYIYNANVFDKNLYTHLGHAICDEHDSDAEEINAYRDRISGKPYNESIKDLIFISIAADHIDKLRNQYEKGIIAYGCDN